MPQDSTGAVPPNPAMPSDGELGWRWVSIRASDDPAVVEEFETPLSPNLHIAVVTSGTYPVELRCGRTWHHAEYHPGSVTIVAPDHACRLRWRNASPRRLRTLHLDLSADLLDITAQSLGSRGRQTLERLPGLLASADPLVEEAVRSLGRAAQVGAPASYADSVAQMLAAHVLYGSSITDLPTEGALTGSALGDVLDYMRSNLHGAVGLDELAAVAHLTKYHFLRSFAKSTGVTPHRYLVRLRMRRAAALLLDQGPTVLQVARACGYHSQGQFAAAFRREYGTSPREFRRQRRR